MKRAILVTMVWIWFILTMATFHSDAQKKGNWVDLKGPYLGQMPPGNQPQPFAPGIVTTGHHDRNITFSPDLKELFFTRTSPYDWHSTIIHMKLEKGIWTKPILAPFITSFDDNASYPFISPNGNKVFFESKKKDPRLNPKLNGAIWVSEKKDGRWGKAEPIQIENRQMKEGFPSVAASGNIYFWAREKTGADANIYYYEYSKNRYKAAKKLHPNISGKDNEFHPYIAPDESYIMFDRFLPGISQDLYISFKKKNGSWTRAINMGKKVNAKGAGNMRPYVTPDGKYLFLVSTRGVQQKQDGPMSYSGFMKRIRSFGNHSHDIYWVDANIIQELKREAGK